MNGVIEVLEFLGYDEIRLRDGSWQPLTETNGALGTTDDTYVILEDEPPRIRLRDPETGEEIGQARKGPTARAEQPTAKQPTAKQPTAKQPAYEEERAK